MMFYDFLLITCKRLYIFNRGVFFSGGKRMKKKIYNNKIELIIIKSVCLCAVRLERQCVFPRDEQATLLLRERKQIVLVTIEER